MAKDSAAASNQTAEKLLLVLEALARQNQPVKLVDLAHQVGMNQSTCYRFVAALQNAGYAAQDKESGKYILNLKLCSLAEMIKDRVSITSLLHAFVAEASALFQESAHLVQEENRQIVYIDNVTISSQSLITQSLLLPLLRFSSKKGVPPCVPTHPGTSSHCRTRYILSH